MNLTQFAEWLIEAYHSDDGMPEAKEICREARAALSAQPVEGADAESKAMFVARLENMSLNGDTWLTIPAVLALLNDCDMLATQAAPAPEPSAQAVAHPSHQTVREWMPVSEALRLSDLWTAGDLDNCGQWRAAIKVLADEVRALAASPQREPSAQAVAGAVATDETGWLIEHSGEILPGAEQRAQVSWLRVQMKFNGYGAREFGFTHDANKALRFARKEDAEAVLAMHLGASPPDWYSKPFSVTEHMWPAASQAQAAPAPEPSRSQKMREAGFTARDTRLTCDECGAKFTPQFAPLHECAQPAPSAQGEPVATVTEEMVTAYLTANDAYWKRIDGEPTKLGKWRNGTPSEATRVSLMAALASAPSTPPPAVVEAVPLTDEQADALRRLWPAIEKAMGCLVFTAEQAGAVQADMNTIRHGIAPKAAQEKT